MQAFWKEWREMADKASHDKEELMHLATWSLPVLAVHLGCVRVTVHWLHP